MRCSLQNIKPIHLRLFKLWYHQFIQKLSFLSFQKKVLCSCNFSVFLVVFFFISVFIYLDFPILEEKVKLEAVVLVDLKSEVELRSSLHWTLMKTKGLVESEESKVRMN